MGAFIILGSLGIVFGLTVSPKSGTTSTASAHAFLDQIPDHLALEVGEVLYTRTEVYQRYGPKAEDIAAGTGIPTEHHVVENWQQIGPANTLARSFARLFDDNDNVLRESVIESGVVSTIDAETQQTLSEEELVLDDGLLKLNAEKTRANRINTALSAGNATILSQTTSELTVELIRSAPNCLAGVPNEIREAIENDGTSPCKDSLTDFGEGEWKVPFYADLDVEAVVSVITIRNDGIVLMSRDYVVSPSGVRTLIFSAESSVAILDQMPDFVGR